MALRMRDHLHNSVLAEFVVSDWRKGLRHEYDYLDDSVRREFESVRDIGDAINRGDIPLLVPIYVWDGLSAKGPSRPDVIGKVEVEERLDEALEAIRKHRSELPSL